MSIGVPIKVLHEAEGHIVTCETNTGEVYRGKLIEAEDNMNCQVGPLIINEPPSYSIIFCSFFLIYLPYHVWDEIVMAIGTLLVCSNTYIH